MKETKLYTCEFCGTSYKEKGKYYEEMCDVPKKNT